MKNEADGAAPAEEFANAGPQRKVTAIVRASLLKTVEEKLRDMRVPGISVTRVKGYGEYANFFRNDWTCEHARIEIFCRQERAREIARGIVETAQTGGPGDGIVVVLPVESVYRIRTGECATADELGGCACVADKTTGV